MTTKPVRLGVIGSSGGSALAAAAECLVEAERQSQGAGALASRQDRAGIASGNRVQPDFVERFAQLTPVACC